MYPGNTPLTGISSYTQLLLDGATSSDRDMLEKIENQTQRASGITRSLLSLARPEQTEFEPLDLNEAVQDVVLACRRAREAASRGDRIVVMGSFHAVGPALVHLGLYCGAAAGQS